MKSNAHIRFREISLQNFMSFGPLQRVRLSRQGLTLIEGRNGQGKSTILDALCWVIYGKTLRKLDGVDKVVNRRTQANCCVKLKLEVGGVQFELHRYRADTKHKNKLFIFANGKDITRKDTADEQVVEILNGLDISTFKRVVVFSKRDLVSFAALTDAEQKEVFEKLLGVEELNLAFKRAQERLRDQESELDQLKTEVAHADDIISAHRETVKSLRDSRAVFAELKEAQARNLREQIEEAKQEAPAAYASLKKDVEIATTHVAKTATWRAKISRKLEAATETYEKASEDRERARAGKDTVTAQHRDLEERLDPLIGVDMCPTCEAPVGKDKKAHWKKHLAKLAKDVKTVEERFSAAHKACAAAQETRRVCLAIEDKASDRAAKERAVLEGLQVQLDASRAKKKAVEARVAGLQKQLDEAQAQTWGQAEDLAQAKARLASAVASKAERERRAIVMTQRVKYTEFWVRGFGRAGLPTDLIDSVIPVLTARAQSHLGRIAQGAFKVSFDTAKTLKSGESRDKFVVHVDNADGADSYRGNSVGELALVDLAISLALQDLAAMRAQCSVNVQFFDEAFDGCDGVAADSIAELLTDLARSKESLFVVTHLDTLKASFPHVLHIEKRKRYSQVSHGS